TLDGEKDDREPDLAEECQTATEFCPLQQLRQLAFSQYVQVSIVMTQNELRNIQTTEHAEPYRLFGEWLKEAEQSEPNDPNALALATVDANGMPNVRMVLLKGYDERGFVFYTN